MPSSSLAGDFLGALHDGHQRGGADQVGQAADHPAGALMQVLAQLGQRAGPVAVQPQRGIQRGQQAGPLRPGTGTGRC